MRFGWNTYRRVLQEGFDAFKMRGPFAHCPYGSDERNGIWVFAKQQAKKGCSFDRTVKNFKRQEGIA